MKKIAVIGCGMMGSTLINTLLNEKKEVIIVTRTKDKAEPFIKRGAEFRPTINDASEANLFILSLPTHEVAKDILKSCQKDLFVNKTLLNTTTCSPDEAEEIALIASDLDMQHLEGKIMGHPYDIGTPTGYIVYSGDNNAFNKYESILKAFGKAVFLGEKITGAAITDLSALAVHYGVIASLTEASAYCMKNGFAISDMINQIIEIVPLLIAGNIRAFDSELSNYTGKFKKADESMITTELNAVETIKQSMNDNGVKTPIGDAIMDILSNAVASGNGDKNIVAIVNELL